MNSFELSRTWFNWCFDNTAKISPSHGALYFFIIEHNNRLGWKEEFGLPREMAMEAIGIRSQRTFTKVFNELEEWGFIEVRQRSKNQYTANIIALSKKAKATTKALDKARLMQSPEQDKGKAHIDKPYNPITLKPENSKNHRALDFVKKEYPQRFETDFEMKYLSKIENPEKFTADFNDTVDQEGMEFTDKKIFARLGKYARNWIDNQNRYRPKETQSNHQTSKIPIG